MADKVIVTRNKIADYLEVGSAYVLMGAGFNSLDESPSAQVDTKAYINDASATSTIKSYQTVFPFDTDLIVSELAIADLYDIGRNQKVGGDAERNYVRVELFNKVGTTGTVYEARKFRVAVQVDSIEGAGGEVAKITGNLNNVGSFVDGTFDLTTKTFTPAV